MASTDPTKALQEADAAAVAAIAEIGDPTARYSAAMDLADWHQERARDLIAHPPAPADGPPPAAAAKTTKAAKA